jgi:hypothetical protein
MSFNDGLIFNTAALFMMASCLARAADSDWLVSDEQAAVPPATTLACNAAPSCTGDPLDAYVPDLTPGFQYSASLLLLKPGADNLGFGTITTFLPLQNPQWAVQTLNPAYQPGFRCSVYVSMLRDRHSDELGASAH